ncbi:MAG: glutathione peroxidase [Myxococcales bacterium]|nr:glutathione peroxidase [Myxococcales bacterium]
MTSKSSALDHVVKDAFGEDHDLKQYRGKAVLIVNVASRCGYTPQYKGLQELHKEYSARGLQVLGFPCNQFMGQEPGTDAEIQDFCRTNYGVEFPVLSKVEVNGTNMSPVYRSLTQDSPETFQGKIGWNFEKFLVNKEGNVVGRFNSRIQPKDKRLVDAIESVLQ